MELTVDTSPKAVRAVRAGAAYPGASVSAESWVMSVEVVTAARVTLDRIDATIEFTVDTSEKAVIASVGYIAISVSGSDSEVSVEVAAADRLVGDAFSVLDVVVWSRSSGVVLFR
jgi:hypothetical protein